MEGQDNTVTPRALLCDYGHSTLRESPEYKSPSDRRATPLYTAPELLKVASDNTTNLTLHATNRERTTVARGDVWAWGMTVLVRTLCYNQGDIESALLCAAPVFRKGISVRVHTRCTSSSTSSGRLRNARDGVRVNAAVLEDCIQPTDSARDFTNAAPGAVCISTRFVQRTELTDVQNNTPTARGRNSLCSYISLCRQRREVACYHVWCVVTHHVGSPPAQPMCS